MSGTTDVLLWVVVFGIDTLRANPTAALARDRFLIFGSSFNRSILPEVHMHALETFFFGVVEFYSTDLLNYAFFVFSIYSAINSISILIRFANFKRVVWRRTSTAGLPLRSVQILNVVVVIACVTF